MVGTVYRQDDKGLVAICVAGMPPFAPHTDDPARAVLATLEARSALSALGICAAAGVATGAAYSGFVGGPQRREMCAMGSTVIWQPCLWGLPPLPGVPAVGEVDDCLWTVLHVMQRPWVCTSWFSFGKRQRRSSGGF